MSKRILIVGFAVWVGLLIPGLVLLTFSNEAEAAVSCVDDAWTVTNETEMNDAIVCYNNKSSAGTYTITLSANITLTASLTDTNSLTETAILIIDGSGFAVDGQDIDGIRPFFIEAGTRVNMQNLIIQDGTMGLSSGGGDGGAIYNNGGYVALDQVLLKGNTGRQGGAIRNGGYLTITNSVIQGNTATPSGGGAGIAGAIVQVSGGSLHVENSTFTANFTAFSDRAIIKIESGSTAEFNFVTIANNSSRGLNATGPITISNSILSGNSTASCYTGTPVSGGYNIVDDVSCPFGATGDMTDTNPVLDSLIDNGDYTSRLEPGDGSPAINAIPVGTNGCATTITADQIGTARQQGSGCEIGAIELQIMYDLTTFKDGEGSGTITSSPSGINCGVTCTQTFNEGAEITLSPSPVVGSLFGSWSGDCTGSGSCILDLNSAKTVTATFSLQQFNIGVNKLGFSGSDGTVTSDPAGIDCGDTCNTNFGYGTIVTLTAVPNEDSLFTGWLGGSCSGTGPCVITVEDSLAFMAEFNVKPNTPPTATNDLFLITKNTTLMNNVITGDNGLGPDEDADNDTLTATLSVDVMNGVLSLEPSGAFVYTPTQNYTGTDQFVYELTDGETYDPPITATAMISIVSESVPIVYPPVAVDDTAQTDQGVPVTIDVLANDTDIDSPTLTLAAVGIPNSGTAVMSGTKVVYTPLAEFSGNAVFTYTVSDGSAIDEGEVTVTVNGPDPLEDVDSGFRPSGDGYKFENYGTTKEDTFTPSAKIFIELYGASQVCKIGTLNEAGDDCVLDVHILALLNSANDSTFGQAYGMVVSAMRFFMGVEAPTDVVSSTTEIVPLLGLESDLKDHIGRYTSQQLSEPQSGPNGWLRNQSSGNALNAIKTELAAGTSGDPYLMLLYGANSGNSLTLFPYRVVETGTDLFDVYVYDPNHPLDNTRKVAFNLATGSWTYSSTIPGTAQLATFDGTDQTSLIDLRALSGHQPDNLKFVGAQSQSQAAADEPFDLFETGEPMAFTTENCFSISGGVDYDNAPDQQGNCNGTSSIADSGPLQCIRGSDGLSADDNRSNNQACGLNGSVTTDMEFTLYEDEVQTRQVGSSVGHTLLMVTDLGNVVAVEPQAGNATSGELSLTVSPDAQSVTVNPDDTNGTLPALSLAVRGKTANQPSYMVTITADDLAAGSTLTAQIDPDTGYLFFEDDDGSDVSYSIKIDQIDQDGTQKKFANEAITLDGEAAFLDFGNWDGGEIDLYVDEEGDGFGDEQAQQIENNAHINYLPIIVTE